MEAPKEQRRLAEISLSDVAFVAQLISIPPPAGHCPGSGIAVNYQLATYRVERVVMGTIKKRVVVVGHVLMSGASGLDPETGCLSPEVFKPGARFVILARSADVPEIDFETSGDAESVFPADKQTVRALARVVADCTSAQRQPEVSRSEPTVGRQDVVTNQTVVHGNGLSVDLRNSDGLGLTLTNEYFGRLGVGWPDEVVIKNVALAPGGRRAAIEISNTEGVGAVSLVAFVGKMCPPRVLSPTAIPAENGWSARLPKAASPVWVSEREIAFVGTSLVVPEAEPWVYIQDIDSGRVRSIRMQAPALSLTTKDNRLVCVTADGEVPLSLAEEQLPPDEAN